MPRKHKYIYRISRHYTRCEVWTGSSTHHHLIGRSTCTPDKGLSSAERERIITDWLYERFGIRVKPEPMLVHKGVN